MYKKNLKWLFVGGGLQTILSIVSVLILITLLSKSGYGEYVLIMSLYTTYSFIGEARVGDIANVVIFNPRLIKDRILLGHLLLIDFSAKMIGLLVFLLTISYVMRYTGLEELEYSSSVVFFLSVMLVSKIGNSLSLALDRITGNTKSTVLIQSAELCFRVIFQSFSLILFPNDIFGLIAITCFSVAIYGFYLIKRLFKYKPILRFGRLKRIYRKYKIYITSNILISNSDLMTRDLDIVLISKIISLEGLAVYKLSKIGAMMIWRITDPYYISMAIEIPKIYKQKKESVQIFYAKQIKKLNKFVFFGGVVSLAVSYIMGELIFVKYSGLYKIFFFMIIAIYLSSKFIYAHSLSNVYGKPHYNLYGSVLGTVCGVILIFPLTQLLGVIGSAMAWSISFAMNFYITVLFVMRHANGKNKPA